MVFVPRQVLPKTGIILVLNGTSSAGKTSIARELQWVHTEPFHHLQLNAFRDMEPPGHWDNWKQQPAETMALKLAALNRAMHAALAQYARHGQNVIFDTVLSTADSMHYLLEDLSDLHVLLLAVHCNVEVLAAREKTRGDRPLGLAASQVGQVHTDKAYDLEVDTSATSVNECAMQIAAWLSQSPVVDAFTQLRATHASPVPKPCT